MAPTTYNTSPFNTTPTPTAAIVNGGRGSGDDSDIPAGAGAGAGSRVRVAGSGRRPATHGSRTMILDPTETVEEGPHHGILDLTGEHQDVVEERRVQWDDDVIDNEHMNKKKSKICCIFKKQREFGESSDESSSDSDSSGSESDGGPVSFGGNRGNNKGKDKRDPSDGDDKDGACEHAGDPNHHHHHHKPKKTKKKTVNAYERAPKVSSTPKPINAREGSD